MYSKSTDTHQDLYPSSCHASHIADDLPTSVTTRIRRNCSDRVENVGIFKDTMAEYKRYLLKSGYLEELIDEKSINFAAKVKKKEVLEKKKRKKDVQIENYRMVTDFEPTFPDIKKNNKKISTHHRR